MKPRTIQDPIFVRTAIFQEHEAYGFMQSFSWIVSITKGMIHLVKIDRFQTQREKASSFVALLDSSSACLASINSCTRLALQGCDRTSSTWKAGDIWRLVKRGYAWSPGLAVGCLLCHFLLFLQLEIGCDIVCLGTTSRGKKKNPSVDTNAWYQQISKKLLN